MNKNKFKRCVICGTYDPPIIEEFGRQGTLKVCKICGYKYNLDGSPSKLFSNFYIEHPGPFFWEREPRQNVTKDSLIEEISNVKTKLEELKKEYHPTHPDLFSSEDSLNYYLDVLGYALRGFENDHR